MHFIDYILIAVIAVLLGLAIGYMRRQRKSCGGCASCPYAGSCKKISTNKKRSK